MHNKKLSVVQIIDRLNVGGAEQVLVSLANILYAHGHDAAVITTVTPGPLAEKLNPNIPLINLNRGWKWNPATMYRLVKAAKKFDVVHVHSSYNLRYLFLASRLFFLQKKIFFHEHFGDIDINKKISWHQKFIYPRTVFIAVSRSIYHWALDSLKLKSSDVFLLSNIVQQWKRESKMIIADDGTIQLLLVSNFRNSKNISFAISLLHQLNMDEKKFHLTIIGQPADKLYFEEIKHLIEQTGLDEAVTIIQDCADVQPILHRFHLAIHTAISESGPLVLIEYMAQSLPFLSYETGEVVAQIKNELPECIIDSFNPNEWIKKIEHLLNTDKLLLRQKLSKAFDTYYSEESYYEKCIAIYEAGLGLK